jgi:hypothetical protein
MHFPGKIAKETNIKLNRQVQINSPQDIIFLHFHLLTRQVPCKIQVCVQVMAVINHRSSICIFSLFCFLQLPSILGIKCDLRNYMIIICKEMRHCGEEDVMACLMRENQGKIQ